MRTEGRFPGGWFAYSAGLREAAAAAAGKAAGVVVADGCPCCGRRDGRGQGRLRRADLALVWVGLLILLVMAAGAGYG
jgi:hypothetical protein